MQRKIRFVRLSVVSETVGQLTIASGGKNSLVFQNVQEHPRKRHAQRTGKIQLIFEWKLMSQSWVDFVLNLTCYRKQILELRTSFPQERDKNLWILWLRFGRTLWQYLSKFQQRTNFASSVIHSRCCSVAVQRAREENIVFMLTHSALAFDGFGRHTTTRIEFLIFTLTCFADPCLDFSRRYSDSCQHICGLLWARIGESIEQATWTE